MTFTDLIRQSLVITLYMSPCLALTPVPCSRTAYIAGVFYLIRTTDKQYSLHNMQRQVVLMDSHRVFCAVRAQSFH